MKDFVVLVHVSLEILTFYFSCTVDHPTAQPQPTVHVPEQKAGEDCFCVCVCVCVLLIKYVTNTDVLF